MLFRSHLKKFIYEKHGVLLCSGSDYGKSGEGFLRMNIACNRTLLEQGLEHLKEAFQEYEKWVFNAC